MKILINQKQIRRRQRLSNAASLGGLALLLASVVLPLAYPALAVFAMLLMVLGLAMAMIGIYFANRWVKKPRPEDVLDHALKGLSDLHRLYHYPRLPCDHVLLTPWGVVVLETINLEGKFTYKDGRWKERISLGRALRYIVEEHLGNPIRAALGSEAFLRRMISEAIPGGETVPVQSVVVFVHPAAILEVENAETPVCKAEKLRRHVTIKGNKLPLELYERVRQFFDDKI